MYCMLRFNAKILIVMYVCMYACMYVWDVCTRAHPGPVCYRKGGPLAVTDANVFLGRIQPHLFPAIFGPQARTYYIHTYIYSYMYICLYT